MSTEPVPPTTQTLADRPRLSTTDRLLAGILAMLVLLVASFLVLAGTVYVVARPVPAPTGASGSVQVWATVTQVWATVTQGYATSSLAAASGITTVALGGMAKDEQTWDREIAFGGSVEVTVMVTQIDTDEDAGESGSANCSILIGDRFVAKSVVDVENGVGSCTWTNDGK